LNLGWRHRLSALSCIALVIALALRNVWLGVAALGTLVALNMSFYALLTRRGGLPRTAGSVALHFFHHLVAVAAVPLGTLMYVARRRQPRPHKI